MALPEVPDTPDGQRLTSLVAKALDDVLHSWPWPEQEDYAMFGLYLNLYCSIDFALRRTAQVLNLVGMLPKKLKTKVANMAITTVERTVLSAEWSDANRKALHKIVEYRATRNLIAHYVIRRFPDDPAFVFLTSSALDYKRETGITPTPGTMMTYVVQRPAIADLLIEVHDLHNWLLFVSDQLEDQYLKMVLNKKTAQSDES